MLLSGQESIQTSRYNYLNLIKDDLYFNVTNRMNNDTTTKLTWGESVLIGMYDTSNLAVGDEVALFSDTSILWTVYSISDHWIVISFLDTTGVYNFTDYMNTENPTTTDEYKLQYDDTGWHTIYIRKIETHKTYKNLNVQMKSLDTLNEFIDFGEMYMISDMEGNIIVYNLSLSLFNNITEKNLEGVLFDLCIDNDTYNPIIRGITFVEKVKELNYLVFSYNTNFGKQYILFTTNTTISSFAVYPDVHMTSNIYNDISTDIRIPSLYLNMMNDIYASELILLYDDSDALNDPIDTYYWAKEIFTGDVLYDSTLDYPTPDNDSYTVLDYDDYDSTTETSILRHKLTYSDTYVTVADMAGDPVANTFRYTKSAGTYDLNCDVYLSVGSRVRISTGLSTGTYLSAVNCGTFTVTGVGNDYFEIVNASGLAEVGKFLERDSAGGISFNDSYIKSYEEKMFLIACNENGRKRFNLNNLLLEFDPVASTADYVFRMMQIYYDDSADGVLLYMTYFPAMTFYDAVAKTFRVMI